MPKKLARAILLEVLQLGDARLKYRPVDHIRASLVQLTVACLIVRLGRRLALVMCEANVLVKMNQLGLGAGEKLECNLVAD